MANFVKTNEKVEITFNGWDGKSYNGETRIMDAYTLESMPDRKFIKFYSRRFKEYTWHIVEDEKHEVSGGYLVSYWCSTDKEGNRI